MKVRKGRPASGITGFGTESVSGRSRVPSPPARTSACNSARPRDGLLRPAETLGRAADALDGEARRGQKLRVEEVASVDDDRPAHALLDLGPVELAELRPPRNEHRRVGAAERVERRRG